MKGYADEKTWPEFSGHPLDPRGEPGPEESPEETLLEEGLEICNKKDLSLLETIDFLADHAEVEKSEALTFLMKYETLSKEEIMGITDDLTGEG